MINDLTDIIQEIKKKEYMQKILETEFGINPEKMFTCINPKHADKHPSMGLYAGKTTDRVFCHCFSCNVNYDIIDIIAIKYELDVKKDFLQIIKIICGICGIKLPENNGVYVTDVTQYIKQCKKNVANTDYFTKRGLSAKTIRHFGLGFDPERNATTKDGNIRIPAAIIPTSDKTYIARCTDKNAPDSVRYRRFGNTQIFNFKEAVKAERPIFVTEGEIDAMSIYECGFNALALGGISNCEKFAETLLGIKPLQKIIIALDNDKPGREAAEELKNRLTAYNIHCGIVQPYNECKDANEALQVDKERLTANLAELEKNAIQETKQRQFDIQFIKKFANMNEEDKQKVIEFMEYL